MNKQLISNYGKVLFLMGFFAAGSGAFAAFVVSWRGGNPFLLPGIGLGFILLSFALFALGSRVGDK